MKKQIGKVRKRIVALSLVALMAFGALPVQPVAELFDTSITASAETYSGSTEFTNLIAGDILKKGAGFHNNLTGKCTVYLNGSKVAEVHGSGSYMYYVPYACKVKSISKVSTAPNIYLVTYAPAKTAISPTISVSDVTWSSQVSPSVSGNPGGGTVTYYYSTSSSSGFTTAKPTKPGTYYVYATVAETTNYKSGTTGTKSFTIHKAAPSVTAPTGKSLTYNGKAQALINAGSTSGGTMQYSLDGTNWSTSIPTGTNAGSYTIRYRVVGDDYYNDVSGGSVTTTIAKATPTVTAPGTKTLPYNGKAQTLVSAGSTTGGTLKYSLDNSNWDTDLPQGTAVKDYPVYYMVEGNSNYNSVAAKSVTSSIVKGTAEVTAPTGKQLTYDGTAQPLIIAGSTTGGTMEYSLDGTKWDTDIPKGTNANDYTIYYRVVGGDSYEDVAPKTVTSKIAKADPEVTAPIGKELIYNGEDRELVTAGSTTGGTMQYSLDGKNWSNDIPQEKNVGVYPVYYKVVGDDNYNGVDAKSVTSAILRVAYTGVQKDITVLNIDKKDEPTVTAYQLIKGTYRDNKLTGYVLCDGLGSLTIADMEKPTEDEVTAIAAAIRENKITLDSISMTRGGETEGSDNVFYTADAEPGLYIVLVTDSTMGYVYNPAVVAVNVNNPADISDSVGGTVDMTSYFDYPPKAYIKSSRIALQKSIVDNEGNKLKGTSASFGETVNFRIDNMVIPSYSHEYESPQYIITDELEASAFDGINGLTVKVDGTAIAPGSATFTITGTDKSGNAISNYVISADNAITINNSTSFKITFAESFLYDNEGKSLVIDYYSVISDTAGYNYSENQNVATLLYTNNPGQTTEIKDKTYHYTFGISANIDGEDDNTDPNQNKKHTTTNEINKVTEESNEFDEITDENGNVIKVNKKALQGAEFTLYNHFNLTDSDIVAVAVSDKYGRVSFTGLKAGTYYLAETAAPSGYTIKATIYRIEIIPTFDEIGVLTSYTINTYVADENGQRGEAVQTASYTNTGYKVNDDGSVTNNITIDETIINPLSIINTKLALLPSTGGMGTVMITIGASLGMAAFLAMFIVNKKKKDN